MSAIDGSIWLEKFEHVLPFEKLPEHAKHIVSGDDSRLDEFFSSHRVFSLKGSQFDWLIGASVNTMEMIRHRDTMAYPEGVILHFDNRKMLTICGWGVDYFQMLRIMGNLTG